MKRLLGSWFHRNAHSAPRRAYFAMLRRVVGVFGKTQRVYFVDINGRRYKRVVFSDGFRAWQIQKGLETFSGLGHFPRLIAWHENELLLEFIEGEPFDAKRPEHLERLSEFFADLYHKDMREISFESSGLAQHLQTDLRFLSDSDVIDSDTEQRLLDLADSLQPDMILFGWDYDDPVEKNFLIAKQKLVTIDVEALKADAVLGVGLAKAQLHWLDETGLNSLLDRIQAQGGPDIRPQMDYIALSFRAAWAKRKVLQGKRNFIERAQLSEWADRKHSAS